MGCLNSKAESVAEPHSILSTSNPLSGVEAHESGSFAREFRLGEELGSGAFSVVRLGTNVKTGEKVAVKIISKGKLTEEDEMSLRQEISILQDIDYPNIVKLFGVYEEKNDIKLVLEVINGGELFDRIVTKSFYNEKEARDLVYILLKSIKHLHDKNIVHKDLKPENLLMTSKTDDASIKLADFGFAERIDPQNPFALTAACGTPG